MKTTFFLFILLSSLTSLWAQDGTLDNTFGSGGIVTTPIGTGNDQAYAILIQPDGKLLVGGFSGGSMAVVRYNSNGTLDNTFDSDGMVTAIGCSGSNAVNGMALQTDGKIVLAGNCGIFPDIQIVVIRLNTNGSFDNTFDSDGIVVTNLGPNDDRASAVAIQTDGKIVIAGNNYNGANNDNMIARYNTDGSLDTSFDTDGVVTTAIGPANDILRTVLIQPDGKIVASGYSFMSMNNYNFSVSRYNTNGSLDLTFDTDGLVTTDIVPSTNDYGESLHLQTDGKLVLGGYSFTGNITAVRYLPNGTPDNTFATGGEFTMPYGGLYQNDYTAALQSDGKFIVAGYSTLSSLTSDFAMIRLTAAGALDNTFGTGGMVNTPIGAADDIATTMLLQPDGKIVLAGRSHNGTNFDFSVVRYNNSLSTGNVEEEPEKKISIHPNPFTSFTTLSFPVPVGNATLTIHDQFGRLVMERNQLRGSQLHLAVEDWAAGIYFVMLRTADSIWTEKIVLAK